MLGGAERIRTVQAAEPHLIADEEADWHAIMMTGDHHPASTAIGTGGTVLNGLDGLRRFMAVLAVGCLAATGVIAAAATRQPVQVMETVPIPPPLDHPFAGTIALRVDAIDVARRIFTIRERVPVQHDGAMTLLYPRWEVASHGPSLTVTDLAGLEVRAADRPVTWRRDPIDPHAFHLDVPNGTRSIDVSFQIIADGDQLSPNMVVLQWQRLILYPAGWYARNVMVAPTAILPAGLRAFTSLELVEAKGGDMGFAPVSLETLLDSPVHAARYAKRVPLMTTAAGSVWFDLLAERPADLAGPSEQINQLRRMVTQTQATFGPAPFGRYEIIARMSDNGSSGGTEHRRSSEISIASGYFREWAGQLNNRDIVAHEFVHAWNGLYRVPADLWAPTPNVPQGTSLLWVYEGLTEFWGRVLAARSGLRSTEETLDKLATDAAEVTNRSGRQWRPLSDDVNYPAFMLRQPVPWRDWQRRKDYYLEGVMLWLDVDAILRERSGGSRSMDDFARTFFAGASASGPARTYTFSELCVALNAVVPFDWSEFLRNWINGHEALDTSAGLVKMGWHLTYTDTPSATFQQNEQELGITDLSYSLGLTVADDGTVRTVAWNSSAYRASMAPGVKIVAISSESFSPANLIAAVKNAVQTPISLTWQQDGRSVTQVLDYQGTLRYPRLERVQGRFDRIQILLAPR
jgi:predicted metalloprotease with PDZ domain